ncbi:MAG: hypothetical protein GY820_01940 [Gammaproteobacteria bacterium]|nr:hypothetical protein [Gammaproteobacteria bacterium]
MRLQTLVILHFWSFHFQTGAKESSKEEEGSEAEEYHQEASSEREQEERKKMPATNGEAKTKSVEFLKKRKLSDGFEVQTSIIGNKDVEVVSGNTFPQQLTQDLILRFQVTQKTYVLILLLCF